MYHHCLKVLVDSNVIGSELKLPQRYDYLLIIVFEMR